MLKKLSKVKSIENMRAIEIYWDEGRRNINSLKQYIEVFSSLEKSVFSLNTSLSVFFHTSINELFSLKLFRLYLPEQIVS